MCCDQSQNVSAMCMIVLATTKSCPCVRLLINRAGLMMVLQQHCCATADDYMQHGLAV